MLRPKSQITHMYCIQTTHNTYCMQICAL